MAKFRRYQHLERFGKDEVRGIEEGTCYIFAKLDGGNGSMWMDEAEAKAGSRNGEVTPEKNNGGFFTYARNHEGAKEFLKEYPNYRLYGEWLIPHTIKGYTQDAWRKFYVFDVTIVNDDPEVPEQYLSYDEYRPLLEQFNIDYIPMICKLENPSLEDLMNVMKQNTFLLDDEKEGEGITIKNYEFKNKYGRTTWAKLVDAEFKEKHTSAKSSTLEKTPVEKQIVDEFCTAAFIEKEYAKIVNEDNGEWTRTSIPKLMGRVFSELVKEETYNFVKRFKHPVVDFRSLDFYVKQKIREVKSDLF